MKKCAIPVARNEYFHTVTKHWVVIMQWNIKIHRTLSLKLSCYSFI